MGEVVVAEDELRSRIAELGKQVAEDYEGREPLLVGVLKGAFVFMSDLARAIDLPVEVDFMAVASYGSSTKTSGIVRIEKDLDIDLTGRDVLLVEDIVDSRADLALAAAKPAGAPPPASRCRAAGEDRACSEADPDLRYVGFHIPPDFVVGYGLDVGQRHRNLPEVRLWRP